MSRIIHYCRINSEGAFLDGEKLLAFDGAADTAEKLLALYRHIAQDYPKFYKMDLLSKISFLGVELLKLSCPGPASAPEDAVALLFANSESSSDTDIRFRDSYEIERLPGPSLFVYTLPNIALGEISIRNKWYGEHMFAVFPNFAPAYFTDHSTLLLDDGAEWVIGGWVNVINGPDALVFTIDKTGDGSRDELMSRLEELYRH
ncbi:MAG: hypothetical protein ABS46_08470 [Cytophagaceae bacterium SCN 52-12]|nr:MAG: hypothetical protein ABS46_08470 [Cytophagaceae bacterium SCN 52-12]